MKYLNKIKTHKLILFAFCLLILSVLFFLYRISSYNNTLTYWGNRFISDKYWLHPLNHNIEGIYIVKTVRGNLNNINKDLNEYKLLLKNDSNNLDEFTFDQSFYRKSFTNILIFNGASFESSDYDLISSFDYLLNRINEEGRDTIEIEIIYVQDISTGSEYIDKIFIK